MSISDYSRAKANTDITAITTAITPATVYILFFINNFCYVHLHYFIIVP
jgi:hypothetical protein